MSPTAVAKLLELPEQKRLEIAEMLWLSVTDEASLKVADSHKRILKQRLTDYATGKVKAISHAELMRRVRG